MIIFKKCLGILEGWCDTQQTPKEVFLKTKNL